MNRVSNLILLIGDVLALSLFVFVGQADHRTVNAANPLLGALPNIASLALPWLITAWLLQAYPRREWSLRSFLGRSLLAWLIAVPIGLAMRALWLGRGGIPVPFLLVTFAVGGLFLVGWRTVYFWLATRGKKRSSAEQSGAVAPHE